MTKKKDSGNLSIDFLVGFTIFIIAFIWVVSLIPGMLIGLQSQTIDYDAVAYRTGVILVEDPGEPALPQVPWELNDKRDVVRFGLAITKGTPNVLSQDKVERFFCSTVFSYPDDYQKRAIFGDYPYQFNISLLDSRENRSYFVGDPLSASYGTIRRLVQIKGTSNATINGSQTDPNYISSGDLTIKGSNETKHEFTVLINNTRLLNDAVRNPAYQINPANEPLVIDITHINSTMFVDRAPCFNVGLTKIYAKDENHIPIQLFYDPIIDGVQQHVTTESDYASLPIVTDNVSLILEPSYLPWSNYPQVYLTLTFNLTPNNACGMTNFTGSRFLNNSFTYPFSYDYNPNNVTQSDLRNAVMEVDVGSGYRTQTGTLVQALKAGFNFIFTGGNTVQFKDQSIGLPSAWKWEYRPHGTIPWTPFGTSSLQSFTFPSQGTYDVQLTVTDNSGNTDTSVPFQTIDVLPPGVAFSGTPTSGPAPLFVAFTDSSTHMDLPNPTWNWEYNKTQMAIDNWTQFSVIKNPGQSFPAGTYDIRLTAKNIVGSSITLTKYNFITATALPVADFTANVTSGPVPLAVKFTDQSSNVPDSWYWEYKNSSTSTWLPLTNSGQQNPTQLFPTVGTYDIRLTAYKLGLNTTPKEKLGYIVVSLVGIPHNIIVSEGVGGMITPNKTITYGTVVVFDHGSQSFVIKPNDGYHITAVIVNNTYPMGAVTTYTFTNVVADQKISATFAANPPQTIYYNDFETAAKLNQWTLSSAFSVTRNSGGSCQNPLTNLRNCTGSAQIVNKAWMQKTISTTGYTSITVSYNLGVSSLSGTQNITAQWRPDGASPWITLRTITHNGAGDNGHLNLYSDVLPTAADKQANFALQFILSSDTGATDYGYVDDVKVVGTPV